MPIITARILTGRSTEMKADLVRELAQAAVRALGVREEQIRVLIEEYPPEHWGAGSKTKAELDGGSNK
ncbi:MAG: tautomerase family protein [Altererythrobacter sp.]